METVLEHQRSMHEERERILHAMCKERMFQPKTHREKVNSEHRQFSLLNRYAECTVTLKDLYEDKDGLRKADIKALSGPNEFNEFYERLKDIKDFHKRHPEEISTPLSVEFDELLKVHSDPDEAGAVILEFSDEESYGKYLDLHECHEKYLNLKGADRIDYLTYLSVFDQLFDISKEKKNSNYRSYLQLLIDYLSHFVERVSPMVDLTQEFESTQSLFETQWNNGEFPGWGKEASSAMTHSGAHLDLSAFSRWEELASLGLDRLKSALLALGLKCGGSLDERAQRLWSTKGKKLNELDATLFARAKVSKSSKVREFNDVQKELASMEAKVYRLVEFLSEQRAATKENVTRKQSRLDYQNESDEEDAEMEVESDDDDADDIPYNPKNLPLGWDGKPIPYWLYKLHGLNLYYSCEICGNQTYRGPKAFQRHFAEWRHAHGMRCLGIPNTAHFANVTSIEDAIALWQKIRNTKDVDRWKPEADEEYEDSMGNVVSKKTFEDLKRQGLL